MLALIAAGLAALIDAGYLAIIRSQGNTDQPWRVVLVASVIALLALAAALGGRLRQDRWAAALLTFATVGFIVLGVLAIFSIGLPLILAGGIALVAAIRVITRDHSRTTVLTALVAAAVPVLVIAGGFHLVPLLPPGCPDNAHHVEGTISDGGGTTHYVCENGRLVQWSRSSGP